MVVPADIRISAIGTHVPPRRALNAERLRSFGLEEGFLRTKLGVVSRAVKGENDETSTLCVKSFEDLRAQTGLSSSAVQLCCVVTQNPDVNIPHTAAIVHQKLGLPRGCMTFDISQGCAGYVHAVAIVHSLMATLGLDQALLFTCDPYSKVVDPEDKNTALIFGDAATVTSMSRGSAGYALVDADFGTEPGSASCLMMDSAGTTGARSWLRMDGTAVLFHATHNVPPSIRGILDRNKKRLDDVDLFLLHPGSKRVVDLLKKDLGLPDHKVPFEIEHHGNTVSSSIPLMLKQHVTEKKHGCLVLSGFGVGFSWGTCIVELRVE